MFGVSESFKQLKDYVESEEYKGWDPYDGLNSRVFKGTPIKHWYYARLAWIQGFKRSPINFRKPFLVPKEHNAKGIGLFLTSYCNIYKTQQETGTKDYGDQKDLLGRISYLAELLISMKSSKVYSGACWGYNFDWQNRVFFQPKNTPTVVATSFCANALFNAFEVTDNKKYLETALSSARFVIDDLNRTKSNKGFIFSYSPLDHSCVYNASLLGTRLLARSYHYTKDKEFKDLAREATKTIVDKQNNDGSWIYGEAKTQNWIDSFHTGYNLECLSDYFKYTGDDQFQSSFSKGFEYYIENFFLGDGRPKYYNNKVYPIDIHSPAQFVVTLEKTGKFSEHATLVEKVVRWTIVNMQDKNGYFYYQIKPFISSKIPYMRWAQAWMFYAFSHYMKYYSK
ncbi:MAG: hypothetical protein K9H06_21315 [Melioribacteraceae bacterium]|nr:hypothetical protein [Melioribacteraceae bacterium]